MLLDKIAEALWNENEKFVPTNVVWSDAPEGERERFGALALAALKAMAVPTPEMLSQGNRALQAWDDSEHYRSPIGGIYRAMLAVELPVSQDIKPTDQFDEL